MSVEPEHLLLSLGLYRFLASRCRLYLSGQLSLGNSGLCICLSCPLDDEPNSRHPSHIRNHPDVQDYVGDFFRRSGLIAKNARYIDEPGVQTSARHFACSKLLEHVEHQIASLLGPVGGATDQKDDRENLSPIDYANHTLLVLSTGTQNIN